MRESIGRMAHCNGARCTKTTRDDGDVRTCSCDCETCSGEQQPAPRRSYDSAPPVPVRVERAPIPTLLAAVVIVCVFGAGAVAGYAWHALGVGRSRVDCVPNGGALTCTAKNESLSTATLCWDAVLECSDKPRRSHACSSALAAGGIESRVVDVPEIPADVHVRALRVENVQAQ